MNRFNTPGIRNALIALFALIFLFICVIPIAGQFFYVFQVVEEQELGVQFKGGQIQDVVGPGIYSDFGLYVDLRKVSAQSIPFEVVDPEIITKDKQRIGLVVSGDIFRPSLAEKDIIRDNWAEYRNVYLDDNVARERVSNLAKQAMKVCVGDRTFDANIIGTSRDELRTCIDTELDEMANRLGGLRIENLVVPEVVLSAEVQEALDSIVQSRLATEKAAQDALRERAQAEAEQARQEGQIRIEQSRLQEQTRQQTALAQLEQERLGAQLLVIETLRANELAQLETERQLIEAQKENDLLAAERELEITAVLANVAEQKARADTALKLAEALILAQNPDFLYLESLRANASALQPTDKIIFTPEGTIPTLVIPGPGIVPTINTAPAVPAAPVTPVE
jgi:hypothetical protein